MGLLRICVALFFCIHASFATNIEIDILNFALNLEYLEATFYSYVAHGKGLSAADRGGGPAPTGNATGFLAKLGPDAKAIALSIAADELAHVRFLRKALGPHAVPAPKLDVGVAFGKAANLAFGQKLRPPFSPYQSDLLFYLGAFIFEDVGVTAYKGAARFITNKGNLEAAAGILAVEAYHAGVIRSQLLQIRNRYVSPYGVQVKTIVQTISNLRAGASGRKDDRGIIGRNSSFILAPSSSNAIAFGRSIKQILSIVYLKGKGKGGFFPNGLSGRIK